jgi:hypothetical protein
MWFYKALFSLFFFFDLYNQGLSQKVVLYPNLGFVRSFNSKIDVPAGNDFKSPANNLNVVGGLGLEYVINNNLSLEANIDNGILAYSYQIKKTGNACLIVYSHFEGYDVLQLNLGINKFSSVFPMASLGKRKYSAKLKFSVGLGLNKFGRTDNELNEMEYFYKSVCPDGQDSLKATTSLLRKTAKWGGHIWTKFGIRVLNQKGKEMIDLSFFYNQGLTKQYEADIEYYLNTDFYTARLGSKGSQMGLRLGFPIRFRSKEQP